VFFELLVISHACAVERERERETALQQCGARIITIIVIVAVMITITVTYGSSPHRHGSSSSSSSSTLAPETIKPPLSDIPSLAPAYELFTLSTQILSLFPQ